MNIGLVSFVVVEDGKQVNSKEEMHGLECSVSIAMVCFPQEWSIE